MTATRHQSRWNPHGRHRSGPHLYRPRPRRRHRIRLVLSLALLAAALGSALGAKFDPANRPGDHANAATGTGAAYAVPQAPAGQGMPMQGMPMQGMPGMPRQDTPSNHSAGQSIPPVPPSSPLYTAPPPNDAPLSAADRDFLTRVRLAGLWEGQAGRKAQVRSQNPAV